MEPKKKSRRQRTKKGKAKVIKATKIDFNWNQLAALRSDDAEVQFLDSLGQRVRFAHCAPVMRLHYSVGKWAKCVCLLIRRMENSTRPRSSPLRREIPVLWSFWDTETVKRCRFLPSDCKFVISTFEHPKCTSVFLIFCRLEVDKAPCASVDTSIAEDDEAVRVCSNRRP